MLSNLCTYRHVHTCEEIFERLNWIVRDPRVQSATVRLDENEHSRTHARVFTSVRKIIGLYIISIAAPVRARRSVTVEFILERSRARYIPSERNGRTESGREKRASLRRERNKKKRGEGWKEEGGGGEEAQGFHESRESEITDKG